MPTRAPNRSLSRRVGRAVVGGCVALALLAPTGVASASVAPTEGASGVGDPYWPLDGNGGIDVASYKIRTSYDLASGRLRGRTRLRLTATQDLSRFSLDFLLPVQSVRVDSTRARFRRARRGHELQITPARPLAAGSSHTVVVRYDAKPRGRRYAGESNWLANRREMVAMNEPHMAPWWFPSNDHPSDKALVSVDITVPKGTQAISNGNLLSKRVRGDRTTWHWRADEPMAPYLAFFAVGDFRIARGTHRGLPWLVAVSEQLSPRARRASMRLMRRTPAIVDDLEADLGDYPFSTTGGLTTSLPVGFALENQTRPTYPAVGGGQTSLVVHELAHQWFGDHIAVARWRDIWLNEGFASFMEWRWSEVHRGGSAAKRLSASYSAMPAGSSFWDLTIADPGADGVFDWAIYERGAMTVQALRNRVGEDVFWRLIRTWLERKGGGNGTSEEFEALAAEVSGQDLSGFFTAWLRTPRRPARTAANGLG